MAAVNETFEDEPERSMTNHSKNNSPEKFGSGTIELQVGLDLVKEKELNGKDSTTYYSGNIVAVGVERFWINVNFFILKNKKVLKKLFLILLTLLVFIYLGAVIKEFQRIDPVVILWCEGHGLGFILFGLIGWTVIYYALIVPYLFPCLKGCLILTCLTKMWRKLQIAAWGVVYLALIIFLGWDTSSDRRRLLSLCGLLTFIALGFFFSKYPTRVRWRTLFAGLLIQFSMGIIAIRWGTGRQIFKCIGFLTEKFLDYSYVGASVVFGDFLVWQQGVLAFKALSAIFFVSMIVQVLFYLGWMQIFCKKFGWIIQVTMGTTVMESVNAVSSVFLGMTEAPLLYKPYIKDLTQSEIHAVMVGGFSTIAGSIFAAYTSFGIDPAFIITAALMSAPAALCYAKLTYPETVQSKTDLKNIQIYKSDDKSVVDAAIQGALVGINMIQGIIATIIACVSFVAFLNSSIGWLGELAGIPDFSLETMLSYLLFPVVWLMGVEPSQCFYISRLIGIKITVNEFVAYRGLGELKKKGVLSMRSEAIATFALCSFANPGSLGILISTLSTLCPAQRLNIVNLSIRAMLCSIVVTFLTACIAGSLMPEEGFID